MKQTAYILIGFVFCLLLCCCNNGGKQDVEPTQKKRSVVVKRSIPKTISVYRYDGVAKSKAIQLAQELRAYFPKVIVKEETLPLPSQYYNKERNRYKASGLVDDLAKHRNGDVIIGVTDYVIFEPNKKSPTYGIMGLGRVGAYKCVVSTKIPKSRETLTDSDFTKLVLHELGHAFGLEHCTDSHCYMIDAEHKLKFPKTTRFCNNCKTLLNAKGWTIK